MSDRPLLLDLFSGQGGCSEGYRRAGFRPVGVDNRPQPRYPFPFARCDALDMLRLLIAGCYFTASDDKAYFLRDFAAIHASPPCQRYSQAAIVRTNRDRHPDLVAPTRALLEQTGKPWIMENVVPAPLSPFAITLCGLMFGLKVFRHRRFESSHWLTMPEHPSHDGKKIGVGGMCCVVGHSGGNAQNKTEWSSAMGIDWMTREGLSQAIPPAYCEHLGRQLLRIVEDVG